MVRPSGAAVIVAVVVLACSGVACAQSFGPEYINDDGRAWSFTRTDGVTPAGTLPSSRPLTSGTDSSIYFTAGTDDGDAILYLIDLGQSRISDQVGTINSGDAVRVQVSMHYTCSTADCDPQMWIIDGDGTMVGIGFSDAGHLYQLEGTALAGNVGSDTETEWETSPSFHSGVDGDFGIDLKFTSGLAGYEVGAVPTADLGTDTNRVSADGDLVINAHNGLFFGVSSGDFAEALQLRNIQVALVELTCDASFCDQSGGCNSCDHLAGCYTTTPEPEGCPGYDPCNFCDLTCTTCPVDECVNIEPVPDGCPCDGCDLTCNDCAVDGTCTPTDPAPAGCPGYCDGGQYYVNNGGPASADCFYCVNGCDECVDGVTCDTCAPDHTWSGELGICTKPIDVGAFVHANAGSCTSAEVPVASVAMEGPNVQGSRTFAQIELVSSSSGAPLPLRLSADGSLSLAKVVDEGTYEFTLTSYEDGLEGVEKTVDMVAVVDCPALDAQSTTHAVSTSTTLAGFADSDFAAGDVDGDANIAAVADALSRGLGIDADGITLESLEATVGGDGVILYHTLAIPDGNGVSRDGKLSVAMETSRAVTQPLLKQRAFEHTARLVSRALNVCCTAVVGQACTVDADCEYEALGATCDSGICTLTPFPFG